MDDYRMTGAVPLPNGVAEIGHQGADVVLRAYCSGPMILGPDVRTDFQKHFMEAERSAEAWAAEHAGVSDVTQPTFTHRAYGVDVEWFGDEGGMVARGHVPDLRFVAACNHLARTQAKLANIWDDPSVSLDDVLIEVGRCWGLPIDPAESSDPNSDWALRYDRDITEQTPGAIAITVLAP